MSSDSSEDENLEKFREAADSQFINDSMFRLESAEPVAKPPQTKKPPSLRQSRDNNEQFNQFRNTPEFRKHVSKHLSKILDKILKNKLDHTTIQVSTRTKHKTRKSGIKLFRNSPSFVKIKKKSRITTERRKVEEFSLEDNQLKCESVAVDPEEILSGNETKNWSNRSKAPVYKYRQTQKGLVPIEN